MCGLSEAAGQAGKAAGEPVVRRQGRGRTLVLAIGNSAAGDDGFGPAVLAALEPPGLPQAVDLADGGILGVDLLSELEDYDRLIVIDAVRPRDEGVRHGWERGLELEAGRSRHWVERPDPVPGGVVVFRLGEVELEDPDPRFSLHDLSFGACLRMAGTLGLRMPEITVVGYTLPPVPPVPEPSGARVPLAAGSPSLDGMELSSDALAAVPLAAEAVRNLLAH
jgi:hypothetical protein